METGPLSSGSGEGLSWRHAHLTPAVAGRCHLLCRLLSLHRGSCQRCVPWVRCSLVSACSYQFCHISLHSQVDMFLSVFSPVSLHSTDDMSFLTCLYLYLQSLFLLPYRANHCSCPLTLWATLAAPNSLFLILSCGSVSSTMF